MKSTHPRNPLLPPIGKVEIKRSLAKPIPARTYGQARIQKEEEEIKAKCEDLKVLLNPTTTNTLLLRCEIFLQMLKHPKFRYNQLCSQLIRAKDIHKWRVNIDNWMQLQSKHMWKLQSFVNPELKKHLSLYELAKEGVALGHILHSKVFDQLAQCQKNCVKFENMLQNLTNTYMPIDKKFLLSDELQSLVNRIN